MAFFHDKDKAEYLAFSSLHGENIKISNRGKEAEWIKNHKSGICVSNRTMGFNETITLKYEGSGHFLLGLVYNFPNIDLLPDSDVTDSLDSLHWEYFRFRKSKDIITISRSFNQYILSWTSLGREDRTECLPEDENLFILICIYFGDLEIHIDTDTHFPVVFDNRHGSNIRLSHQQQRVSLHHYNPFAVCCIQKPLLPEKQIQIMLSPIDDANWLHCHIFLSNVSPDVIGLANLQSITDNSDVSAMLVPFGSMIEENTSVKIALLKSGEIASNVNLNSRKNTPREIDMGLPIFVYIEIFRMRAVLQPVFCKKSEDLCYSMSTTIPLSPFRSGRFNQSLPLCFSELPPLTPMNTTQIRNMSDTTRRDEGNTCNHITEVKTPVSTAKNFDSGESGENGSNEETSRKQFDGGTQFTPPTVGFPPLETLSEYVPTQVQDFEESIPSRFEHSANSRRYGPNIDSNMLSAEGVSMEQTLNQDFNVRPQHELHDHICHHITEVKTIAQSVVNYSISDDDSSNDETSRKDWDDEQQYTVPINKDVDDYVDMRTEAGESVPTSDKDFELMPTNDHIHVYADKDTVVGKYIPALGLNNEESISNRVAPNSDRDILSSESVPNEEMSTKYFNDTMTPDESPFEESIQHGRHQIFPPIGSDLDVLMPSTRNYSRKPIPTPRKGSQQSFPIPDVSCVPPIPPRSSSQLHHAIPDNVSCVPSIPPRSVLLLKNPVPDDATCVPPIPPRNASHMPSPPDDLQ